MIREHFINSNARFRAFCTEFARYCTFKIIAFSYSAIQPQVCLINSVFSVRCGDEQLIITVNSPTGAKMAAIVRHGCFYAAWCNVRKPHIAIL